MIVAKRYMRMSATKRELTLLVYKCLFRGSPELGIFYAESLEARMEAWPSLRTEVEASESVLVWSAGIRAFHWKTY